MGLFLSNIDDNQRVKYVPITLKRLLIVIIPLLFAACIQQPASVKEEVLARLKTVDSLVLTNKADSAVNLLLAANSRYANVPQPFLAIYYCIRAQARRDNELDMNATADSAVAEFSNETLQNLYPRQYYTVLITKGMACYVNGKFNTALQFFYKAKSINGISDCDLGELMSRLGGIYYDQQNYLKAAQSWYASYQMRTNCDVELPQQKFALQQGQVDNAGLAYERAGLPDSAAHCFFTDIKLIEDAVKAGVDSNQIKSSKIVVFDNLGGFYLKRGMFDSAEYYLTLSTGINWTDIDGATIPPQLKLASLYTQTGRLQKAIPLFRQTKQLLDRHPKYNPESKEKWHQFYAAFLFKSNRPAEAYNELNEYIRVKDSVDRAAGAVMTLNVGKEFNTIQQQQTLNELKVKDKVNKIYLWAISMVIILSFVIIFLVYRNLKKSRKNYQSTIMHNQQLQGALEELEDANKNYIRVMRVMAHDLRNPLGGITGIAGILLKEDKLDAEQRHMIKLVESTGNHSMDMINELLNSGLAQQDEPLPVQPHDITLLLHDTIEVLEFKAAEKKQTLTYTGSTAPVIVNINHEKMWRVFNNVIMNAVKFTPAGGTITVSINRQGNRCVISVADNGVGIPDADKPHVFDMFTPAKKTGTGGEKPFGLGLSISKRIIERHNGKIWFESVEGKGTTFYIELAAGG